MVEGHGISRSIPRREGDGADFLPEGFGFRPRRQAHDALEVVRKAANRGQVWCSMADIASCFDEIDRGALVAQIERPVSDRRLVRLVPAWLRAGVFEGGVVSEADAGTAQGSPLSPLLVNVALRLFDQRWARAGRLGTLVRYADDLVVVCATASEP